MTVQSFLKIYIKKYKKLVNMPYNKLNLENYEDVISKLFKIDINVKKDDLGKDSSIKLMSGNHTNAGLLQIGEIKKNRKNIIVVGKGVLFDSGGYNLKSDMTDMKTDMAGMACAVSVVSMLRDVLKSYNICSVCPVTTNFIHNSKLIPGDVITIGDKKVEVTDTDAEGRLILAEALSSFKQGKKDIIITVATLTGAVGYAIGDEATGVFTENDKLSELYLKSAELCEELAWRLPMWKNLEKKYYSNNKKVIKNYLAKKPGATMATLFLKQFIKYPKNWLHLDIAESAYDEDKERATGEPFNSLLDFIEKIKG